MTERNNDPVSNDPNSDPRRDPAGPAGEGMPEAGLGPDAAVAPGASAEGMEPNPDLPDAVGGSRSYWQLTREDFCKNRWAMASVVVVFIVTTLAVFCPLIANNRPYMINAVFEGRYDESYFVMIDMAERAIRHERGATLSLRDISDRMATAHRRMAPMVPEERQARFQELTGILRTVGAASQSAYADALAYFQDEFDIDEIALVPATRYPVLRVLTPTEMWFMGFYILAIPLVLLGRRVGGFWRALGFAAAGAFLCTWALAWMFPRVEDNFPYRRFIESQEFADNGWSVVRAIVPYGENENITSEARQPPTFLMPMDQRNPDQRFHLLGTDTNGRDVLCRMIYGARISMLVGIVAVSIYVTIGILLGALAGYFGGWIDLALSRIIEVVICFPVLFLILAVQAFLQPSIINIMVALALVSWTGVARLQRGEFIRLVNLDFVQGVRAIGGGHNRIIFMHILPNAIAPILVLASFGIAGSILVESTLSFLGFGVPPPTASWGDLLNNGRNDIQGTWWLTIFPGFAIFLTVTCFNLVGEGIRDALDPRRRH